LGYPSPKVLIRSFIASRRAVVSSAGTLDLLTAGLPDKTKAKTY
jgi:hypothetical protein